MAHQPDVEMEDEVLPCARPSWDERRQLVYDILNLSPPDIPGALLIIQNSAHARIAKHEYPLPAISAWDATVDDPAARLPSMEQQPIQMDCVVDLDTVDTETLHRLRLYVEGCYIPHYVPKENCMICEGLWSSGRVIACGNDECETRIHEECFGTVLREEIDGPWHCPTCLLGRQLHCAVCMQPGGALKPLATTSMSRDASDEQRWVHVLCALAIPELVMRDVPTMEPVDGFDEIENGRFRYLCGICRKRGGASVICDQENCNVGMHPLCAANAGFMIGHETKPLAVYCEKHLPVSRVAGAKRWISDEDLVEEIMSENSIEDEGPMTERTVNQTARYAFILQSTPTIYAQSKLLGTTSTLPWGPLPKISEKRDIKAATYENLSLSPRALGPVGVRTRRPLVFPPQEPDRIGLPAFPQGDDLLGAIVEYLMKDQDEWVRARIIEWDTSRQLHLLQVVSTNHKVWAKLTTTNTLVLCLPDEAEGNAVEGPRVKIYRPVRRGVAEWRPRPRKFAATPTDQAGAA